MTGNVLNGLPRIGTSTVPFSQYGKAAGVPAWLIPALSDSSSLLVYLTLYPLLSFCCDTMNIPLPGFQTA